MIKPFYARRGWAALTIMLSLAGCGSRTTVEGEPGPPPPPECVLATDCENFGDACFPVRCLEGACVAAPPVTCDDRDPCTIDRCDSITGACTHPPATLDLDGDGHRAPLAGFRAGEPGSCGDDCDDANRSAFPGGREACDGADNDCNGVVDDGAGLEGSGDAVNVSQAARTRPGSLAYGGGDQYLAAYSGEPHQQELGLLGPSHPRRGTDRSPQRTHGGPADADGGPLVFTGDRFGIAWSDRRDARGAVSNYEIYFNLLNPDGTKRMPDLRLSHADGFSIGESLAWTGKEFVVLWQDDGQGVSQKNVLYGQRIDVDGALIGGNVKLIDDGGTGQFAPAIAAGERSLGVTWARGDAGSHQLMFAPFDHELKPLAKPVALTAEMDPGTKPTIVYNKSQYVISWHNLKDDVRTSRTVFGAAVGELGEPMVAARTIVKTSRHAQLPALLPYGDRVLLVWSDDRNQNRGYELYAKTLSRNLDTLAGGNAHYRRSGREHRPHLVVRTERRSRHPL